MNAATQQTVTYRIVTIRDPRTPGFRWYEVEGHNAGTGQTWTAAICDTKDEARDTLRAMEGAVR
jgi:hypothetical protein